METTINKKKIFIKGLFGIGELGLLITFVAIFIFFSISSRYFFTLRNLSNVLGQISISLISVIGFSILLINGEVDISIGSLQAVVALPLLLVMNATGSFLLGVIASLITGAIIGIINGFLVTKLKIHSLLTTLGMLYFLRGGVYLITGKVPISDNSGKDIFFLFGNGKLFRFLPYSTILMFAILFFFIYILKNTTYGRRIYVVGGNPEVARTVGINPEKVKFNAFILCSVLATVSAIILASRIGSANHMAGIGFEFQVVAAAILGGVSLFGGIGTLFGAFMGVLIIGIIQNGLGMLNVSTTFQLVITGSIIIFAVALDALKKRHA